MGSHNQRSWDESRSPQWRYLLQAESMQKRARREEAYQENEAEKNERRRKARKHRKEKRLSKAGREIVYTATPGGAKGVYHNAEFEKSHSKNIPKEGITTHIFKGNEKTHTGDSRSN